MADSYEKQKRDRDRAKLWGKILLYVAIGAFILTFVIIFFTRPH